MNLIAPRFPAIKPVALTSFVVYGDPLADVWIAIRQRNAGHFAPSEKSDALLTGQSHILEVENDPAICSFCGNERFQLGNVLSVDPAA